MIWNDLDLFLSLIWYIIFVFNRYSKPMNLIRNFGHCLEWRNMEYVVRVSSFSASFGPLSLEGRGTFEACIVCCIHEHQRWIGYMWNTFSAAFCWHGPRFFSSGTIFCVGGPDADSSAVYWNVGSCRCQNTGQESPSCLSRAYLESAAWIFSTVRCC